LKLLLTFGGKKKKSLPQFIFFKFFKSFKKEEKKKKEKLCFIDINSFQATKKITFSSPEEAMKEFSKVLNNFSKIQWNELFCSMVQRTQENTQQREDRIKYLQYLETLNELPGSVLVLVHDFTQIKVQGTFYQDLIVCFYTHDPASKDGLCRAYHHFDAHSSSMKNDIAFVVSVWKRIVM